MTDDYYALLEIAPSASQTEIRQAITKQQRAWNARQQAPDLGLRHEAEARMKQLGEARKVLLNAEAKAAYDRQRGGAPAPPQQNIPVPYTPPGQYPYPPPGGPMPRPGANVPAAALATRIYRRLGLRGCGCLVIVGVLVLSSCIASLGGSGTGPGSSGVNNQPFTPLPANVNGAAVEAPVLAALLECAKSAVTDPATCPQRTTSGGTAVQWTLHGDPLAGAVTGVRADGTFEVDGKSVWSVSYVNSGSGSQQLDNVTTTYVAVVVSAGAQFAVRSIGKQAPDGAMLIDLAQLTVPRSALLTDATALQAVKASFAACAQKTSRHPIGCPQQDSAGDSNQVFHWSLTSDPMVNARVTFDSAFGVVHVSGNWTMNSTWTSSSGQRQTDAETGVYDAWVTDDGGKPTVLQLGSPG